MKYLIIFYILIFATNVLACQASDISLNVISHQQIEAPAPAPLLSREVKFKLINSSTCSVYLKGHQVSNFYPIGGYLKRFLPSKKWESFLGKSKIPQFSDFGYEQVDNLEIKRNGSFEFSGIVADASSSVRFKRLIYVSVGSPDSPANLILSTEFSFDSKL